MAKDLLKLAQKYHDAINALDFAAIEAMFAEDAEYHSSGIGGLYGRSAIMAAMRAYFNEFGDQVSSDDSIESTGENSVRSKWRLTATTKSSGRVVKRQGIETIHFTPKGLINLVEVEDVLPCED
jgi:ketosteroid isomerase-like protein